MVETLVRTSCTPCKGGIPPLTEGEAKTFHAQVPQWDVVDEARRIDRTYRFKNFGEAFAFVQKVGELADRNPNETAAIIRNWLHEQAA